MNTSSSRNGPRAFACSLLTMYACGSTDAPRPIAGPTAFITKFCEATTAHDSKIEFNAAPMAAVCRGVYIEPATTTAERDRVVQDYAQAVQVVTERLGRMQTESLDVIVCKSEACAEHFVGPAKRSWTLAPGDHIPGANYANAFDRWTIVIVRADEQTLGHLVHELVHVELGTSLYPQPFGALPLWFHEGVAASIADAPACQRDTPRGIDDLSKLDRNAAWAAYTNVPSQLVPTYCQARKEIETWFARYGRKRLLELIEAVRDGARFSDMYGPLITQ